MRYSYIVSDDTESVRVVANPIERHERGISIVLVAVAAYVVAVLLGKVQTNRTTADAPEIAVDYTAD